MSLESIAQKLDERAASFKDYPDSQVQRNRSSHKTNFPSQNSHSSIQIHHSIKQLTLHKEQQ